MCAILSTTRRPAGKSGDDYDQQAFATFFPDDIGTITSLMDDFVDALRSCGGPDKTVVDQYISYISHYRCNPHNHCCGDESSHIATRYCCTPAAGFTPFWYVTCSKCLAETDVDKLEDMWRELDELWMEIKHWIDIVPDIEYGERLFCLCEQERICLASQA